MKDQFHLQANLLGEEMMSFHSNPMWRQFGKFVASAAFFISLTAALPVVAAAQEPSLSAGTPAHAGSLVTVTGYRYAPSAKVVVAIVDPAGRQQLVTAATDGNGTLSYSLDLPFAGAYTIQVQDTAGTVLASTKVVALAVR